MRRAEIPGTNPDPGENFSLKFTTYDLPGGYSENQIFINLSEFLMKVVV